MFSEKLTQLSRVPNIGAFSRITASTAYPDMSLVTTARILLGSRLPQNGIFSGHIIVRGDKIHAATDNYDAFTRRDKTQVLWYLGVLNAVYGKNNYFYNIILENEEDFAFVREALSDEDAVKYKNENSNSAAASITRHIAIEKFMAQKGYDVLVTSVENDSGGTYVSIVTPYDPATDKYRELYHLIQSCIWPIYEGLFKDNPLTDKEKELCEALTETSPDKYIQLVDDFINNCTFREDYVRQALSGLGKRLLDNRVQKLQSTIVRKRDRYNSFLSQALEEYSSISRLEYEILGLQTAGGDDTAELIDYIISNKQLELGDVNQSSMILTVKTYLSNFDADLYEVYASNENSTLMNQSKIYSGLSLDKLRTFYNAVFVDETLKIRMESTLQIYFQTGDQYDGIHCYSQSVEYGLPNPHLQYFDCFGNNEANIVEAIGKADLIGAIACGIASVCNLNLGDGSPVSKFVKDLWDDYKDCYIIETQDGQLMTPYRAVEYLMGGE